MARIAYRGNFLPDLDAELPPEQRRTPWSTEHFIAEGFEELGHTVVRVQEDRVGWADTIALCENADYMAWTSTWGYAHSWDQGEASAAVDKLNGMLPTFSLHLDKFWDLPRQDQVGKEPWFRLSTVFTADGGNQRRFAEAGVHHVWMPPAVAASECVRGTHRDEFACDLAFVGSWHHYGHEEWTHRGALAEFLRRRYGRRFRCWPNPGGQQIRGRRLADLYASAKIVIGDSCMVGGTGSYCSDRLMETIGRGGFIIHPSQSGVTDGTLYNDGEHLATWPLYDWDRLAELVDAYLERPDDRERIAAAGMAHTLKRHTWAVRLAEVLAQVDAG